MLLFRITFRNPEDGETTTIMESAETRREAVENCKIAIEYSKYRDWDFLEAQEIKYP